MTLEQLYSEFMIRMESLEKLYDQLNSYVLCSFDLFWGIILGVFGVIGIALYFIAKSVVKRGVEKQATQYNKKYSDLDEKIEWKLAQIDKKHIDLENRIDQIRSVSLRYHPSEFNLLLEAEFCPVPNFNCTYSKNADDLVSISFSIQQADNRLLERGTIYFACLPEGFRPIRNIAHTICDTISITIRANGSISYTSASALKSLSCSSISFYAASAPLK